MPLSISAILPAIAAAFVNAVHPSELVPTPSCASTTLAVILNALVGLYDANAIDFKPAIEAGALTVNEFVQDPEFGFVHKYICIRGFVPSSGVAKFALLVPPPSNPSAFT